jgi:hypothetical protein
MKHKILGYEEGPEEATQGVLDEMSEQYRKLDDALGDTGLSGDNDADTINDLLRAIQALTLIGKEAGQFESPEAKKLVQKVAELGYEAEAGLHTARVDLEVAQQYVEQLKGALEEEKQFKLRTNNKK